MALAASASELAAEAGREQLLEPGPLTAAQLAGCAITQADFEAAVKKVQPSVRREGFATTPDVTWADVGSLTEVSCALQRIHRPGQGAQRLQALQRAENSDNCWGGLAQCMALLRPLPYLLSIWLRAQQLG